MVAYKPAGLPATSGVVHQARQGVRRVFWGGKELRQFQRGPLVSAMQGTHTAMEDVRLPKAIMPAKNRVLVHTLIPYNTKGDRFVRVTTKGIPAYVVARTNRVASAPEEHKFGKAGPYKGLVNLEGATTPGWPAMVIGGSRVSLFRAAERGPSQHTHELVARYRIRADGRLQLIKE